MAHVVFSNNDVEVIFFKGSSDYLLITFAPLNAYADGSFFWGKGLAVRQNISTLGFVAKRGNWYPMASMCRAIEAASEVVANFSKIITYGASMGGYAALKYSKALGANKVIAMAPQYSIEPAVMENFDDRFLKHFVPNWNDNMAIRREDVCGISYVFYDPIFEEDRKNVDLIENAGCEIVRMKVFYVNHFPTEIFASTASAMSLLGYVLQDNVLSIKKLVRDCRKRSAVRIRFLVEALSRGRKLLAERILQKYGAKLEDAVRAQAYHKIALQYKAQGFNEGVIRCFLQASSLMPQHIGYMKELIVAYTKAGDATNALEIGNRALLINGSDPHLCNAVAGALMASGDLAAAEALLVKALSIMEHVEFFIRLAKIKEMQSRIYEAIECAKRALALDGDKLRMYEVLASLYLKNMQAGAATETLDKGLALCPSNERLINLRVKSLRLADSEASA